MDKRITQLENTVLELGTEMFRLKHRLIETAARQDSVMKSLKGLRTLLDEKGIIASDDFDCATDLERLLERIEKAVEKRAAADAVDDSKKEMH